MGRVILEDTRNKLDKNAHIAEQLVSIGLTVERCKLYCGDYTWATDQKVCVDTKANMNEIESNLIHDHDRFRAECVRAKEAGIQLVILIQDSRLKSVNDVFGWFNPRNFYAVGKRKPVNGKTLAKIMLKMQEEYGVRFEFSEKDKLGERIVELLGGNN